MMPDKLPSRDDVKEFDAAKLKHVETQEKNVLPSKEGWWSFNLIIMVDWVFSF